MSTLLVAASGVLVVNLPFGFWRAGIRKFSVSWFAAVHLPILLGVGVREASLEILGGMMPGDNTYKTANLAKAYELGRDLFS